MLCWQCSTPLVETSQVCPTCGGSPLLAGESEHAARYRVERVLGRAGASATYRGVRVQDGHNVCVKALRLQATTSSEERALFRREAQVLRELSHPQIPAYFDSFIAVQGGSVCACMVRDYVEGHDLEEELRGRRYREDEVLRVLLQLTPILDYLHELRPPVIHRDIKPANLIRRKSDSQLVLVDFGAVKDCVSDELALAAVREGCLGYMAPEQFLGEAGPATDLYALGALAVALLSRRDPADMLDDEHQLRWRPHVHAHDATVALLEALLATSMDERLQTASAAGERVAGALAALPARTRGPLLLT
jgi:eukaryotic-like serine/threonine-protein kinase